MITAFFPALNVTVVMNQHLVKICVCVTQSAEPTNEILVVI